MVIGAEQKYTGALIVPSYPNLRLWCVENKIVYNSDAEIITNKKVIELYKNIVEAFNKYFTNVQQIKKFELLAHD